MGTKVAPPAVRTGPPFSWVLLLGVLARRRVVRAVRVARLLVAVACLLAGCVTLLAAIGGRAALGVAALGIGVTLRRVVAGGVAALGAATRGVGARRGARITLRVGVTPRRRRGAARRGVGARLPVGRRLRRPVGTRPVRCGLGAVGAVGRRRTCGAVLLRRGRRRRGSGSLCARRGGARGRGLRRLRFTAVNVRVLAAGSGIDAAVLGTAGFGASASAMMLRTLSMMPITPELGSRRLFSAAEAKPAAAFTTALKTFSGLPERTASLRPSIRLPRALVKLLETGSERCRR